MSDPVSNAEIEDVLSSIRRLVSEEPSPLHRRKQLGEAAKERFVLTPALRVQDESESPEQDDQPAQPTAFFEDSPGAEPQHDEPHLEHRQTLEQRIAELEAALQNSADEWEPDGSEVPSTDRITITDFDSHTEATTQTDNDESPEPASEDLIATGPDDVETDLADTDMAAVEETELQTGDGADMLVDAGPDESEALVADVQQDDDEDFSSAVAHEEDVVAPSDIDSVEDAPNWPELDEANTADEPVEATNAELKAPPEAEPEMEPDAAETDAIEKSAFVHPMEPELDHSANTDPLAWDDAVGAESSGTETDAEKKAETEDDGFDIFAADTVLDETALRELVGQLVREELQGVLGERITRNVRRLVRREIQRALTMNDLE